MGMEVRPHAADCNGRLTDDSRASREARRAVANMRMCSRLPLPAYPTDAEPGSAAKVAVLEQRAAELTHLWHPDDAGMVPPGAWLDLLEV